MGFGGSGGGGATSIAGSSDVTLNNPSNNQVLAYDSATSKWHNTSSASTPPTAETIPPGSTLTVRRAANGSWPTRPTSRTDICVIWADLTELSSSDPEGIIEGSDMIMDAGVA